MSRSTDAVMGFFAYFVDSVHVPRSSYFQHRSYVFFATVILKWSTKARGTTRSAYKAEKWARKGISAMIFAANNILLTRFI